MQKVCRELSTQVYAHENFQTWIFTFKSLGISPILIPFEMIFKALQAELFGIDLDSLG